MTRRQFLCALSLASIAGPIAAEAQQTEKVYRVGFLNPRAATSPPEVGLEAFQNTLRERGYIEEQNIAIEYRWAEGKEDRLRAFAAELVGLRVDVIFAVSSIALRAARNATQTIPIVALDLETDPVAAGLAASLARPGGNVTGVFLDQPELHAKWLQLLREVAPRVTRVAVLRDPAAAPAGLKALEAAAHGLAVQLRVLEVRVADDLESAFGAAKKGRAQALMVFPSPAFAVARTERKIADLAIANRLPMITMFRSLVEAGGLISYGVNLYDVMGRATLLLDKVLKGAKPSDLPIERPVRFDLAINLKTAKALGLTIPPSVLVRADHVIE
jgi:putative ABC transport system substrate-binding protein